MGMNRRLFLRRASAAAALAFVPRETQGEDRATASEVFGDILDFWKRRYSDVVKEAGKAETLTTELCGKFGQQLLDICNDRESDGTLCAARGKKIDGNTKTCVEGTVLDVKKTVTETYPWHRNVACIAKMWIRHNRGNVLPWELCSRFCAKCAKCPSKTNESLDPSDCLAQLETMDKEIVRGNGKLKKVIDDALKTDDGWRIPDES